jgi:hypothetical protein
MRRDKNSKEYYLFPAKIIFRISKGIYGELSTDQDHTSGLKNIGKEHKYKTGRCLPERT